MVVSKDEFIKNRSKINDLLEKLRKKLRAFNVINLQGQVIGRIKDFTLDTYRRLYMVIPQSEEQTDSHVFLLSSKYIQKVDPSNRAVFVDLSLAEVARLPVYHPSKDKGTERSVYSSTPPGTQAINTHSGERRAFSETQPSVSQFSARENLEEVDNESFTDSEDTPEVAEEETVRLLEERLIVNRSKRKIGEVVVRKEIATRMVEVPVQREKLIIEKVGSQTKQLVESEQLPVDQLSNSNGIEHSRHSSTPSVTQANITSSGETRAFGEIHPSVSQFSAMENPEGVDNESFIDSDDTIEVAEEEIVRLLEERLIVNRNKWKVGEVVLRKGVETEIVQVPVRREKLIIEQVGAETKQLLEIDLGQGEATTVEQANASSSDNLAREISSSDKGHTVIGEFLSPKAASNLLEAIALQGRHGCQKVRVELVLDNPELQETYQQMFDRCATR
jgi:stress response protein YsnF